MRTWLLTSTTYGTWLPGDPRGSVTSVRDVRPGEAGREVRFEHDLPGEPWEDAVPGLQRAAMEAMAGPPIYLDLAQAEALLAQFQETARHREWTLLAVAVMANHVHLVVEVPGDPNPGKVLGDFKAYGSRTLSGRFGRPPADTWWTAEGSKRKLKDERAVADAVHYVLYKQPHPLVVWCPKLGRLV
jgi:REP element-mobilizing transposase RayT